MAFSVIVASRPYLYQTSRPMLIAVFLSPPLICVFSLASHSPFANLRLGLPNIWTGGIVHALEKWKRSTKMMILVVFVEMAVNYFAVIIAYQHTIKLVCQLRSSQKIVGTAIIVSVGVVGVQLVKRRFQASQIP